MSRTSCLGHKRESYKTYFLVMQTEESHLFIQRRTYLHLFTCACAPCNLHFGKVREV